MIKTQIIDTPQEPTIVLHEPASEQWDSMQAMLEARCNKEDLVRYGETFIPWLGKYANIMCADDDGNSFPATECTDMLKSNSPKWDIARGIALIVSDEQNMKAYISSLSTDMKTLWRTVLANVIVSQQTAKQILHTTDSLLGESKSNYYYSRKTNWNRREFGWFTTILFRCEKASVYGYREFEHFITVNAFVHALFFPHFFPEVFEDDLSLAELPDGNWRTVNLETESVASFQLFNGLFQQGEFPMKQKGIGTTDMKRAMKKLLLTEFFPGDQTEYRQHLRAYSYMQLLALNEYLRPETKKGKQQQLRLNTSTYQDTLRDMLNHQSRFAPYLIPMLFPHIRGLRKQMTEYSREIRLFTIATNILVEEPERWISINDILLKIYELESNGTSTRFTTLVFHPNDERDYVDIVNEYNGRIITADRYTQEFGYTGLQSLAFMLCSLGVVEIALNEDESRNLSPFDSLDYIRLTPLGRYALGVTNDYEEPEQEHVAYFELDPDRLIIRSLVDPNPYAQLLLDTSVTISKNRFETSALSFLANCHKREDVEGKINIFKQFIANELPPLWEQFFQTLLQHCHPLKEDKVGYKRYLLDPKNRDLITLITTDPVLCKTVIRAEGYRILVKNDDLKKFETQLKKHGYLL